MTSETGRYQATPVCCELLDRTEACRDSVSLARNEKVRVAQGDCRCAEGASDQTEALPSGRAAGQDGVLVYDTERIGDVAEVYGVSPGYEDIRDSERGDGMGRYIDADKLNMAFTMLRFNEDGTLRHWDDRPNWCMSGKEVEDLINSIPTADVAERKRGAWIPQRGGGYACSECGRYALDEIDGNFIHVSTKSNYCPNCGADMRERSEDGYR